MDGLAKVLWPPRLALVCKTGDTRVLQTPALPAESEVAYRMGFITRVQLLDLAKAMGNSGYGDYLLSLADLEAPHITP